MDAAVCRPGIPESPLVPYDGLYADPHGLTWILVLAALTGFAFAFSIGANDAANSWGTSVGSGAISVRFAVIAGGVLEFLGAVTLGGGVSSTIKKGAADIRLPACWACGDCDSKMALYMLGMMASLVAAAAFMILASFAHMPVSTTHSIVGAIVGMTVLGTGASCLNLGMKGLGGIVASWVISPLLAGVMGVALHHGTRFAILDARTPAANALLALPVLFGATGFLTVLLVLMKSHVVAAAGIHLGASVGLAAAAAAATAAAVWFFLTPYVRRRIQDPASLGVKTGPLALSAYYAYLREEEETGPLAHFFVWLRGGRSSDRSAVIGRGARDPEALRSAAGAYGRLHEVTDRDRDEHPDMSTDAGARASAHCLEGCDGREPESLTAMLQSDKSGKAFRRRAGDVDGAAKEFELQPTVGGQNSTIGPTASAVDRCHRGGSEDAAADDVGAPGPECRRSSPSHLDPASDPQPDVPGPASEREQAIAVFYWLQVFSACLAAFAHGSNDTSHAAGPFSAVYGLWSRGRSACGDESTELWVLMVMGAGISLGAAALGWRVMLTMADLAGHGGLDFHRGFCMELATALTVVLASIIGVPVSSTHCQVGAILFVGLAADGPQAMRWGLAGKVALSWGLTLPVSGLLSAAATAALRPAILLR